MSIFKESVWETDDTGDKLTKELFLGKKKEKKNKIKHEKKLFVNNEQNGKKFGEEKSQFVKSNDKNKSADPPVARNKINNKKRKFDSITIDENIIKKWKSESMDQTVEKQGANKFSKKEINKKSAKLAERSDINSEKETTGNGVVKKKKKNSESKEKSEKLDKKTKKNHLKTDKNDSDLMTKSAKRRLKQKEKLLNGKNNSTSGETLSKSLKKNVGENSSNSDHFSERIEGEKSSANLQGSSKLNKSKLQIDRLQRLLIAKQQGGSKSEGKNSEPKSLRDRMMARLKSSRFRYLNEQMYNSESWSSKKYFKEDPEAFVAYHEGYKLQVDQWPLNPLDSIIASVKRLPKDYVVADFGCGEARLADSVVQKVHSLDLVAVNDKVTACDMAHTSLLSGRIDVVVFCLSLMGTNLQDYLIEANRVLREDGILKIAEVESRFEDVDEFVKILGSYGFTNTWKDLSHNLFYFMDFKKSGDITKKRNKLPPLTLKSCLYKRR